MRSLRGSMVPHPDEQYSLDASDAAEVSFSREKTPIDIHNSSREPVARLILFIDDRTTNLPDHHPATLRLLTSYRGLFELDNVLF